MSKPKALIIGAGPGVGLAVARRFGWGGYTLHLAARRAEEVARMAAELTAEGMEAAGHAMDAGDPAALSMSVAALGPVEVLVYNAAAVTMAAPMALTPAQLTRDVTISVTGALVAAQAVVPAMLAAGRGTILLTGGGFALRPMAALASLGIGKAALRNMAFSLAEELGPKGIRVATVTILGTVAPGTAFDPSGIAEAYWALHQDRSGVLGPEFKYKGPAV